MSVFWIVLVIVIAAIIYVLCCGARCLADCQDQVEHREDLQ